MGTIAAATGTSPRTTTSPVATGTARRPGSRYGHHTPSPPAPSAAATTHGRTRGGVGAAPEAGLGT